MTKYDCDTKIDGVEYYAECADGVTTTTVTPTSRIRPPSRCPTRRLNMRFAMAKEIHGCLPRLIDSLPQRFRWTPHNLIAHPLSEVLFQLGFEELGNKLHDITVPTHEKGTGRG